MIPTGPLRGVKVLDMSALGPGPFCGMILADHGADVIEVLRPASGTGDPDPAGSFSRGKRSIIVDLRAEGGAEVIARLAEHVDVLLESNRPGTLERRGLGPDVLLARNPRLIYTRLTGWGQHGPSAGAVGHDINYIAGAGVLGTIGTSPDSAPVVPMNLLGDFASGSMMAALGTVLALFEREHTGAGQVVDAAMVDGAALLGMAQMQELNDGTWFGRGRSPIGGAAPFYGTYECSDGRWFAVGAIERRFYADFLKALGLEAEPLDAEFDRTRWPALRERIAAIFRTRSRDEWTEVFAGTDGCGTPVLDLAELPDDPHLRARGTVVVRDGRVLPAPAPRLSRTETTIRPSPERGSHTAEVLAEAGFDPVEIDALVADGVVHTTSVVG